MIIWTQEMVDQLTRLHAEGKTFSEIGQLMQITRHAAIGKARRLDLPGRDDSKSHPGPRKRLKPFK